LVARQNARDEQRAYSNVPFNPAQQVLINAIIGILLMPLLGFLAAVLLNWSKMLLDEEPIAYWAAYKVTTLSSMAATVFLVPADLLTRRLGGFGFVVEVAASIFILGLFYARWIRDKSTHAIGVERGLWLSALQNVLLLLVMGVFYGLGEAAKPGQLVWGLALAIGCAILLVMAASVSMNRSASVAKTKSVVWTTEDISALYRHATEEFERGELDQDLWTLASIARPEMTQRREWYLAERVKHLRDVAEEQLRQEGLI
jgi:hypothetical protein